MANMCVCVCPQQQQQNAETDAVKHKATTHKHTHAVKDTHVCGDTGSQRSSLSVTAVHF